MKLVDPPDLGPLPTFRRLLRLWREQWRLGFFGLACSFFYTLISLAIPILIAAGDRRRDRPLTTSASALAVHRGDCRARGAPLRDQLQPPLRDRADRRPDRGADARAPLPRLPPLPARLLRPARDRAGALARDERPLPHPLLHRLGARAGDAEPDDDHRRRDRPRLVNPPLALYTAASLPPIGLVALRSRTGCRRSRARCRSGRAM